MKSKNGSRHNDDIWEYDGPSKSQLKRDAEELQKLGEAIVNLKPAELERVPLDEELADAIALGVKFKARRDESYRRHLQFIGRLMRSRDIEPIVAALSTIQHRHATSNARLHHLESWRERLISGGDEALNNLLGQFHNLDRQKLRQLIRSVHKEQELQKPPVAYRELFQYLKTELEDLL